MWIILQRFQLVCCWTAQEYSFFVIWEASAFSSSCSCSWHVLLLDPQYKDAMLSLLLKWGWASVPLLSILLSVTLELLLSHFRSVQLYGTPIDGGPPGSSIPGMLQARTLEWVAISFSNAWKWKVKVKSLSRVQLLATSSTAAYQAPPSMGFFQARVLEWGAIAFSDSWATTP